MRGSMHYALTPPSHSEKWLEFCRPKVLSAISTYPLWLMLYHVAKVMPRWPRKSGIVRLWRQHFLGTVTLNRIPAVANRNKRGNGYGSKDHEIREAYGGVKSL